MIQIVYLLDESGHWHVCADSVNGRRTACGIAVVPLVRSTTNRAQVNRRRLCSNCKATVTLA